MIALLNVETDGMEPIATSVQLDGLGRLIVIHVQLDTMAKVAEVHTFFYKIVVLVFSNCFSIFRLQVQCPRIYRIVR